MSTPNSSSISGRARLAAIAAIAAIALLATLTGPSPARAANCGNDPHVYNLFTYNGARCGVAIVISSRLNHRFSDSDDFHGNQSNVRITQRDANGKKYRCKWQSADTRNEIINWSCKRGRKVILWVWREHPIDVPS